MIDHLIVGASVAATPPEANALAGDGTVRIVVCPDGRIVAGVGAVGLVEVPAAAIANDEAIIGQVQAKRAELRELAMAPQPDNKRSNLFTFVNIGRPG